MSYCQISIDPRILVIFAEICFQWSRFHWAQGDWLPIRHQGQTYELMAHGPGLGSGFRPAETPRIDKGKRNDLPAGKLTVCYGTSPSLMGKSRINGQFSIAMSNYQRVLTSTVDNINEHSP